MRWLVAAGCALALAGGIVGWMRVPRADANASANANANASADAKANADADAKAKANANASADAKANADDGDDRVDEVAVEGDLPVYVVRPRPGTGRARAVFLTGSCTHPMTYVNAFKKAAAEHGGLVAVQGDTPCKGAGLRRWSGDSAKMSARIEAAMVAAGLGDSGEITVLGYSQGAERAEWLAHRFPGTFTRFVLMAGPVVPAASRFSGARAVVTLAGYGDVRENMADGAKRMKRASIPAVYMELPGIRHGELAPAVDETVAHALDWIDENASSGSLKPSRRTRARRSSDGPRRPAP